MAIVLYNFLLFLFDWCSVDDLTHTSAHLLHLRSLLNSDISSRTSTCCPPGQGAYRMGDWCVTLFLSHCRSTTRDHCPCCPHRRRLAIAIYLCIPSQKLLLLWPLPPLWTTPPSRPKFSYSGVTPHLIAFIDGAHDLCIAWHSSGG